MTDCDLSSRMATPLGNRIREARKRSGLTQARLGELMGVGQTTIQGWENGRNEPALENLNKLAEKTSSDKNWLIGLKPQADSPPENNNPGAIAPFPSGLVKIEPGSRLPKTNDLPILGHVRAGAMGLFLDQGVVGGYAMRPSVLEGNAAAYAVRVYDDSMKGKLEAGWVLQVDPLRDPRPGDFVVVQTGDGQAFVKCLVRRTDRAIICEQFNPPKQVEYPARKTKLHLVVGIDLISR